MVGNIGGVGVGGEGGVAVGGKGGVGVGCEVGGGLVGCGDGVSVMVGTVVGAGELVVVGWAVRVGELVGVGVSVSVGSGVGTGVVAVGVGGNGDGDGDGVAVDTTAIGGSIFSSGKLAVGKGVGVRSMTTSICKASIVAASAAASRVNRSGLSSFSNNNGSCSNTGTDWGKSLLPQARIKDQLKINRKTTRRITGKRRLSNERRSIRS